MVPDSDSIPEAGIYANDLDEQPKAILKVIGVYALFGYAGIVNINSGCECSVSWTRSRIGG